MDTLGVRLKETKGISNIALVFIITFIAWKAYGLYQESLLEFNINKYIYTKGLNNVIPGTIPYNKKEEESFLQRVFYVLTNIDINNHQSLLANNVPLFKYGALLANSEDGGYWVGMKAMGTKEKPKPNEDYFDQSEEIRIISTIEELIVDRIVTQEQLEDKNYIVRKLINFEGNLNNNNQAITEIDAPKLVEKPFRINHNLEGPKVLIFHTHSMEKFAGEGPGSKGVVDVGNYLKQILETQYGISTMHCTSSFDIVDNRVDRDGSYERMEPIIEKIIKDNPTIQLVIDLHRDGLDSDKKLITDVNGKSTAKLMFVNGLCKVQKKGVLTPVKNLPNPYVEDNIALSLQLQLRGNEIYPGLMRKIYIKPYRYSLHMKPMSLLVEVGAETNTKQEALNAMEPFAEIIMDVLEKD